MPATNNSDECELVLLRAPRDAGRAASSRPVPRPSNTSHATSPAQLDRAQFDPAQFDIVVRSHGEREVIVVAGEIDIATAPALHETLHRLLAEGHHDLGVDLDSVTFMDGRALTFLLAAQRAVTASGGSSTILGHNRLLTRLLQATGLTDELDGGASLRASTEPVAGHSA